MNNTKEYLEKNEILATFNSNFTEKAAVNETVVREITSEKEWEDLVMHKIEFKNVEELLKEYEAQEELMQSMQTEISVDEDTVEIKIEG